MTRKLTRNTMLTLLSILVLMNIPLFFPANYLNSNDTTPSLEEQFDFEPLGLSNGIGEDYWWNVSYQWRQCINITNPGDYNLTNNFISVSFDYATLVAESKMQSGLDDVRIVENGELRNYYIVVDYPSINTATVWFETNSISGSSEYDTYMYFGNNTVGRATNYYMSNHPAGTSWWKFEEGSGTTAIDSLGNYNGTFRSGLPTYNNTDPAIGDWNLDFDGSSDYISINNKNFAGRNIIDGITVSVWFKTNFHGSSYSNNWAFCDFDRSEYFNFYVRGDDGRIGFSSSAYGSSTNDFYGNTFGLNDGKWHFASVVYNGTAKIIYIDDGAFDGAYSTSRDFGTGATRYGFIGDGSEATTDNGNRNNIYYDGAMDNLRYFDYAVSQNEIKWLANYYPLTTDLLTVTERAATVTIIVKDIDGIRVPGAEVSLWENLTHILNVPSIGDFTKNSSEDGTVVFTGVPFGKYNITTNYTLNSVTYKEEYVYDSRTLLDGEVEFNGLIMAHTIYVDLWTIDFEVDDWDEDPLNYGYININESGQVIEKLTLDDDGKATFRWLNSSSGYNYSLYYDNADYSTYNPTLLNWSTITRKDIKTTYLVHEENNDDPSASTYSINVDTFLEGSSYANPGNITAIDASLNLKNMDNMTQVRIWYLGSTGHIYKEFKDYSGLATADTFTYHPQEEETYDVYGLRVEIDGENKTTCNGVIEVSLTYAYNQYIKTHMSKLNITVIDGSETVPVEGVTVRIENNETKELVVELKTDDNGEAFGQINNNLGFWYKTGWTYNFSLWIITQQYNFRINYSDNPFNPNLLQNEYNYTLNSLSSLIFELDLNYQNRISEFKNGTLNADLEVMWGQNMSFSINYTTSLNGGVNWIGDDGVDSSVTCTIKSTEFGNPTLFESSMSFIGNGNYSIEINSSQFSAGDYGKSYVTVISGKKLFYNNPQNEAFLILINSLPTDMSVHNYTTLSELPSNDVSQYYNEFMNITLKYFDDSSNDPLIADSFTYSWDYGSGSVGIDPINPGYYTLEIDTSTVSNTGLYKFDFSAALENHTKIDNFIVNVFIMERPSKLNGSLGVSFYSENVYALNSQNYTFDYFDVLTDIAIANADSTTYTWQKLDELGDPIPGETGSGNLIETLMHAYFLDLDTELMTLGDYFVYVSLGKNNYEVKTAILSLTIMDRPTLLNGSSSFTPSAININLGESLNITFSYVDSLTSLDITNLANQSYTYTSDVLSDASGLGTLVFDTNTNLYVLDFGTASRLNGTFSIIVTLDKDNYTKQTCTLTLIISKVQDNYQSYLTLISKNPLNLLTEVFWRDLITITFNFSTTEDGGSNIYLNDSNSINLQFRDEFLNPIGALINLINYNTSKGIYTYTINTSEFLFIGGNTYQFEIRAGMSGYNPADLLTIPFKVLAVTTDLTIHDYTSSIEFPSYTISEYWNTTLGITIYYAESVSSAPITEAYITFSWFYGSGQVLLDATKGDGYYSFFFDTGNATEVGTYTITFLATKENYTNGVPVSNFIINVINRPTKLNTNENVLYISQKIYVQEAYNFTFEFIDFLTSNLIENADEMSFVLQKLDANGDPIPGESLLGTLFETITHRYVLDLNTETLAYGEYSIVVTFNKDNYDFRVSIISLTINKRVFASQISRPTLMEIESSGALEFQVTLTDPNNSSVSVIGATLYVTIQGTRYDFTDNEDGTYSLNIAFIADAFFMPETIPGILTIEKANFTTSETSITVVVKMTEIFPGMPMFYFLMIVGGIVAVVGSLVGYRVIQQAKIPKFVKKARAMKKEIKGRKSISESLLYPSKDEYIAKKLGDKWEMLGLSLENILGLEGKKRKKAPESTEPKGGAK
ncbi:MAG: LamG domain-containing protein [Promethearchaeota archaeon]